jgi:hypothetical protein
MDYFSRGKGIKFLFKISVAKDEPYFRSGIILAKHIPGGYYED